MFMYMKKWQRRVNPAMCACIFCFGGAKDWGRKDNTKSYLTQMIETTPRMTPKTTPKRTHNSIFEGNTKGNT